MSYELYGDEITYEGRTIAVLLPSVPLSVRMALEDDRPISVAELCDEHAEEIEKARAEAYEDGVEEGRHEALREAEQAAEAKRDEYEAEGFARGRAVGLATAAAAADTELLDKLLRALEAIEITGRIVNGVQEPGSYKTRTAKTAEWKAAMGSMRREAMGALRLFERLVEAA